ASWSLTVEFFFYAIFPFFTIWAYRQSTKKLLWTSIIFWVFSQTFLYILWSLYFPSWERFVAYFPLFHLHSFIMGVVGGIWYLRIGQSQNISPRAVLLTLAGSVLFIALFVIAGSVYPRLPHGYQLLSGVLAPVLVITILSLSMEKTRFSVFLSRPTFVNLGEISYALYIFHVPVIWIYQRALGNLTFADPNAIFDYTFLPLMIALGFILHFYVDIPLRKKLKKTLQRVSMPLLLIDLAILSASIYFSFRFRFGTRREFASYYDMMRLMFWSAFLLRIGFSAAFNALNPSMLYGSTMQLVRSVLVSATIGSAVLTGIIYAGYSLNWFENFPRSVFITDWAIVLSLSLLVRYLFRRAKFYSPKSLAA
ncbi:MAG: acyltransferase family protein, partial [Anaerolineales bacterium]|nr:acyltransferase family protein [Anaerolineales bacterium]